MRKQIIIWESKWALRRTDVIYGSYVTESVGVWCPLLIFQKRRLESPLARRFVTTEFFWEELKCLPLKIILMPKWHILG